MISFTPKPSKNAFGVSHRVQYQENYAGGEILETYAPALPI